MWRFVLPFIREYSTWWIWNVIVGSGYHINPRTLGYNLYLYRHQTGTWFKGCIRMLSPNWKRSKRLLNVWFYRSVHHAYQAVAHATMNIDGIAQHEDPGDPRRHRNGNAHLPPKHQTRNSHPSRIHEWSFVIDPLGRVRDDMPFFYGLLSETFGGEWTYR